MEKLHSWFNKMQAKLGAQACSFLIHFAYFLTISTIGFLALKITKPRRSNDSTAPPGELDLFFTSVSAVTVSSMSTVEMETFSNAQLIIITILMFLGGEVFVSILQLRLSAQSTKSDGNLSNDQIELGPVVAYGRDGSKDEFVVFNDERGGNRSMSCLVTVYLVGIHLLGSFSIFIYTILVKNARDLLRSKGIYLLTFSIFTTVSTFANCGFVPTNENMVVFRKNSGLLLILFPQLLLGNTLYPCGLRLFLWFFNKLRKGAEYNEKKKTAADYPHLVSARVCVYLTATVLGFILIQFVLFCSLEWNSPALDAMSSYEKLVGSLFQVTNSRHTGESIVDLSVVSPAVLVLFLLMMYLPPYTTFLPWWYKEDKERDWEDEKSSRGSSRWKDVSESLLLSPLAYLVLFIILVCITERKKLKEDPLNFNPLNIAIEVISGYGNVGFSTGYSCKRQLKPDGLCKDAWYGFVGRWSNGGKFVLILVMFFGRLKKFTLKAGKAWNLHL